MAPLISMIVEAGEALQNWSQEEGKPAMVDLLAVNGAANWDMCTLAVFTCSRSCASARHQEQGTDGWWSCNEEHVVLVNEDACHVLERS